MKNNDILVLKKIIKYCKDVELLVEKYDNSFEAYVRDISFQYSANMCIIQIGELVGRLSEDFIESNKDIPWSSIKAMRNLHAHDYDNIDLDIVWTTLLEDIPELKIQIEKKL